ncbi:MAG: UMP kinase [Nitrososphaerota archaeon]|nr:UMP kinase [Nitrososphaerota archaeon]
MKGGGGNVRIVLALGGSVVGNGLNPTIVSDYIAKIRQLCLDGAEIHVVIGGGELKERFSRFGRELRLNEGAIDTVGIMITRMYAKILAGALGSLAAQHIPISIEEAVAARDIGKIVVMGGTEPGHSTTTVAALLAEAVGADIVLKVSDVDGVYNADPKQDKTAVLIREMRYSDLISLLINQHQDNKAGTYDVFDITAAKILERSRISTRYFNGSSGAKSIDAALNGLIGTKLNP